MTNDTKNRMRTLLEETITYYGEDPAGRRAVDEEGDCHYLTDDGRRCAIGRLYTPEMARTTEENSKKCWTLRIHEIVARNLPLPEPCEGLPVEFLTSLQRLHDWTDNWDERGLSEIGKLHVGDIEFTFGL